MFGADVGSEQYVVIGVDHCFTFMLLKGSYHVHFQVFILILGLYWNFYQPLSLVCVFWKLHLDRLVNLLRLCKQTVIVGFHFFFTFTQNVNFSNTPLYV